MKEGDIQTAIMNMLLWHPKVAWAYVTSAGVMRAKGSYITVGFAGLSDIIGQLKDGRLFAIEVKLPGNKPTDIQLEFLLSVELNNGVSGWATNVSEAQKIVESTSAA